VDPIRVLLVGLSGIRGEIVRDSVANQLDMDISADFPTLVSSYLRLGGAGVTP